MDTHSFAGLDGISRPEKPRSTGWTMVADWGIGQRAQLDLLETASEHLDFAKIAVGISRLLPDELLKAKLCQYRAFEVEPFPGGQYLEYAEVHGEVDLYFPAVVEAGYAWVEVSDNLAPVGLDWKAKVIRQAVEDYHLQVLGEVGKKEGLDNEAPLVDNARVCVDAGAHIILLEAAELVGGDAAVEREVEAVVKAVGLEQVMFELPGPWIEGVCQHDVHRMRAQMIERYGPQVNLGNVEPRELLVLEAYRRGLGANAGKKMER